MQGCKPVAKTQQQEQFWCAPLEQWLRTTAGKEMGL